MYIGTVVLKKSYYYNIFNRNSSAPPLHKMGLRALLATLLVLQVTNRAKKIAFICYYCYYFYRFSFV